ncbi:PREDICTED: uncharacterized protein LOC104595407 [Nelumbo nucifera]|uniref:C2 NT-type domain-containing protein n=2 Tax=Nelumbo nucifera TaxID=4432 RepID=A0A822Y834_NELNU|nr:PREDICTED: uncharacterized protein LOC104595407 [Nelumbo nucifera]DAD27185.1 TPA_asm: hypothetical protein HUJ06_028653 [Nelumbo nucifera]
MVKWAPWMSSASKKFQVKVKSMKLEGFNAHDEEEMKGEKVVAVKIRWKTPKAGLVPLPRLSSSKHRRRHVSTERSVRRGEVIEWDDEFENVCSFSMFCKDNSSFNPWDVSFNLLYGQRGNKLEVIGTFLLNIAELASRMESQVERAFPIALQVAGVSSEATLSISLSFIEIRSSHSQESLGIVHDVCVVDKEDGFLRRVTSYVSQKKKKKSQEDDETAAIDSDRSPENDSVPIQQESLDPASMASATRDESLAFNSDDNLMKGSSVTRLGSSPSAETRLDSVPKRKDEPLIDDKLDRNRRQSVGSSMDDDSGTVGEETNEESIVNASAESEFSDEVLTVGEWEEREFISRDGQVKLKANVYFATIDQRSEKAAGESACTALVAVIAHWLQSNRDILPTRFEFDNLITEGSSEWRKLCKNKDYMLCFPDKHFDIETVLQAELRPLSVMQDKSFIGFFSPENFESLKEAMSFDCIWDRVSSSTRDGETHVYIVSWNDHFFILKVEANAYYIIDTLGERLFEGCNQAYILKFDHTTSMYQLSKEATDKHKEMVDKKVDVDKSCNGSNNGEDAHELICSGKECCREFIKRFLAAIPLKELEMDEKKGTVSSVSLHQRLQIEFHFCLAPSSSSDKAEDGLFV